MPRLTKSVPKYRKHKASGQAVVTLDGKDFYLGPHNTDVSRREYDRLVGEWQLNGRRLPAKQSEGLGTKSRSCYSRIGSSPRDTTSRTARPRTSCPV